MHATTVPGHGRNDQPGPLPLDVARATALVAWTLVLLAVLANKLSGEPTGADVAPLLTFSLDAVVTVALVALAVCASTRFWQLFAWVTLIGSALDGPIDVPRAVAEMHPGWFVAEVFFVALPALTWIHQDRIRGTLARLRRR